MVKGSRSGKLAASLYSMHDRLKVEGKVYFFSLKMSKERLKESFKNVCGVEVNVEEQRNDIFEITLSN